MRALPIHLAAILAVAILAAGCLEGEADVTCNPDGSGKIVGDILFQAVPPWKETPKPSPFALPPAAPAAAPASATPGGATPAAPGVTSPAPTAAPATSAAPAASAAPAKTPEEETKEIVYNILKRSSGIEAWKNVSYERAADGRIRFKGTAYFKDLGKVKFYPDDRPRASFASDGTSGMVLILTRAAPEKPGARTLSADDLAKRMKADREKYPVMKNVTAMDLLRMRFRLAFHLPGTPGEVKGLTEDGQTLRAAVDGLQVLKAVDALMTDNATLGDMIKAGTSPASSPKALADAVAKRLFGAKGEAWARMTGDFRPRFDYAAEVAAAKKDLPAMMAKLGLDTFKPTPTARPAPAARPPAKAPAAEPSTPPAKAPPKAPAKKIRTGQPA